MLNPDALIEYAKEKGMPVSKTRGIIREYLQTLMLKHVFRHKLGRKLYFLGGTYLRLVHNFKRFSEDLDFNGSRFSKKEFEAVAACVEEELARENIKTAVSFEYRGNLLTAKFSFGKELASAYGIEDKRGALMIKLEVHQPAWKMAVEEAVINNFGETYSVLVMTRGYIFCEKMLALSTHRRGRHVYDLIMMLSKSFPMDAYVLNIKKIDISPKDYLEQLITAIPDAELKKMANSLRPFLFDEHDAVYVERAKFYLKELLKT